MATIDTSLYLGLQPNLQGIRLADAVDAAVTAASNNRDQIIKWRFHKKATTGSNADTFQPYDGEKEIYSLAAQRIYIGIFS